MILNGSQIISLESAGEAGPIVSGLRQVSGVGERSRFVIGPMPNDSPVPRLSLRFVVPFPTLVECPPK